MVKNLPPSARAAGDAGLIPGLGRSLGGGNPFQCSSLGNPMARAACWATVWNHKELDITERLSMHTLKNITNSDIFKSNAISHNITKQV